MQDSGEKKKILVVSSDTGLNKKIHALKMDFPVEFSIQQESYETLQNLRKHHASLFILDYNMPLISGDELLKLVHDTYPDIPIIIIVDKLEEDTRKKIIEAGAFDYLERPVDIEQLKMKVQNLLFSEAYHYHVATLREKIKKVFGLENIIGDCEVMWKVFHAINNISKSDVTVFISGESGTGKELLARAIHRNSLRKGNPLTVINCAAIPENLLESELFGHEKGSFSGAINQRIGKFELADKGTIFLDEIGEMSLYMQSKILRLLEEQEFERVGGNKTIKVDVRIITATNKNLDEEIKKNTFRKDLYYRINVYPINLPPLRERNEDIPILVFYFLGELSKRNNKEVLSITQTALERLKRYSWPGNIRELENIMERAILNCPGKVLTVDEFEHLDSSGIKLATEKAGDDNVPSFDEENVEFEDFERRDTVVPLKRIEKKAIEHALRLSDGNISSAARQLNIGRATLYRKIREYDIRFENIEDN